MEFRFTTLVTILAATAATLHAPSLLAQSTQERNLRLGICIAEDHPLGQGSNKFAQIMDKLSGGKTKVKLENGQVWQQAESGKSGFPMESPRVKVKPMSLGSWLMYIDGCGCDIRVKRVE